MLSQHNKPSERALDRADRAVFTTVVVLIVAAAALRAVHLEQPLLNFHPTRQYRSALIARACYFDHTRDISDPLRQVTSASRALQPAAEPPLMEWLACGTYLLRGHESLSVARAYAAFFWVLGAIPLFAIARRISTDSAALVGLAVYLFLPYAVIAGRAFQPDPLMTSSALWAALGLFRYYELDHGAHRQVLRSRLVLAAVGIAVAAVVKPMSVFMTVPVAIGLAAVHLGPVAVWRRPAILAPVALGLAPAIVYYGYAAVFGTLAKDQMRLRFVPSLLTTSFFFDGLWRQVQRVFGVPVFLAAIAGTIVAARGCARSLLSGMWAGYVACAIAFTYHMPTHDYYHLPFIAVAAVAIAALAMRLPRMGDIRIAHVVIAVLIAAWGSVAAWPRLQPGNLPARIALYQEIGDHAGHTMHAIFLDDEYGYPLMYHGLLTGDAWPNRDDLAAEAMAGASPVDAAARLDSDYSPDVTHFIVTDLESLAAQPDLQQLLSERATVVRKSTAYHIYRFR